MQQRISSSGLNNNYVIWWLLSSGDCFWTWNEHLKFYAVLISSCSLNAVITSDCFRVWNGHLKFYAVLISSSSLTAVITNDCFRVWNGHLKLQAELFIPPEALRLIARAGSMFRKKHIQFATLKTLKLFNRWLNFPTFQLLIKTTRTKHKTM